MASAAAVVMGFSFRTLRSLGLVAAQSEASLGN
jgi:hypothetical protein